MNDGIALTNILHPEGDPTMDDVEINPESVETIEIEVPMNERLKELAQQAGFEFNDNEVARCDIIDIERFAELIRQDEAKDCAKHYLTIMRDAVEQAVLKERELCAKLCDEFIGDLPWSGAAKYFQKAIRARGEK
jgi:hypothetical protein